MEWWHVGALLFLGLFALIAIGVPVGFALALMSITYGITAWGFPGLITFVANSFTTVENFLLLSAPLFIMMGELVAMGGLAGQAFTVLDHWLAFLPGRLAISTVVTSTALGAASGFSSTGIVALGPMVLPEAFQRKYDRKLVIGALGGGAALAVLIPPSVPFIVYGFLAEKSIATLFFAGLVPGLIASGMFIIYIIARCIRNPSLAPSGTKVSWSERLGNTWRITPLFILILAVLGSIWFGIATPTEAAAVGGTMSVLLTFIVIKRIDLSMLKVALTRSLLSTAMVYVIVIGAFGFTQALSASGFVDNFTQLMVSFPVPPWGLVILMMLTNIFLGCFLDSLGVLALSLPVYVPIVSALGIDPIWFGVLVVINTEIGALTPPVGVALYFLKGVAPKGVTLGDCVKGVAPYWFLYLVLMALVGLFPKICLWLPALMGK